MLSFYEHIVDSKYFLSVLQHKTTSINPHFHNSIEFVYAVEGKTEVFIGENKYILNPHELYAVPSNIIHSNKNIGENHIYSIVFSKSFFKSFEFDYPKLFFPATLKNHEQNKKLLLPMLEEYHDSWIKHKQAPPTIKKQAFIFNFLYTLTTLYNLSPISNLKHNQIITSILTYIDEHYAEDLNLETLAKQFNYSPQYFSSLFNKNLHINLNNYINTIRLQKVQEILNNKTQDLPISTIAMDCGFQSLATFYRALNKCKE